MKKAFLLMALAAFAGALQQGEGCESHQEKRLFHGRCLQKCTRAYQPFIRAKESTQMPLRLRSFPPGRFKPRVDSHRPLLRKGARRRRLNVTYDTWHVLSYRLTNAWWDPVDCSRRSR